MSDVEGTRADNLKERTASQAARRPSNPTSRAKPTEADLLAGTKRSAWKVKQELVDDLKLISAKEWETAAIEVRSDENVPAILKKLSETPADWDLDGDDNFNVLTLYQLQEIVAGRAHTLRLHHYAVLEVLGVGGMGEVYKARNLHLPRIEAIKTIRQSKEDDDATVAATGAVGLQRFEQEGRLLVKLSHRHLTTIHHAGVEHGVKFIAMEYVRGKDLKVITVESLDENGVSTIPVEQAVVWTSQVAEVLGHAHELGVIHRDVKPTNVMINERDDLKVLDLGIARLTQGDEPIAEQMSAQGFDPSSSPSLTQGQMGLGTPEVMPPEQWGDPSGVHAPTDIYSLGCTLFFLLTGRMPFKGDTANEVMFAHLGEPPPKASSLRPEVSEELDAVIDKMLEKKPEDRPQTCEQVIELLAPFTGSLALHGPIQTKTSLWVGLAALTAVLLAGGLAIFSFFRDTDGKSKLDSNKGNLTRGPAYYQKQIDSWLVKYQKDHSHVWPNLEELKQQAFTITSRDKVTDETSYNSLIREVMGKSARLENPFKEVTLPRKNQAKRDGSFLWVSKWFSSLPASKQEANLFRLDVKVNDQDATKVGDDPPTYQVKPGSKVDLAVTPNRLGFVTVIAFASDGKIVPVIMRKASESGKAEPMGPFVAGEAGIDRYAIIFTDKSPLLDAPELVRQDLLTNSNPVWYTVFEPKKDLDVYAQRFSDPLIYPRLVHSLKTGMGFPGSKEEKTSVAWWSRAEVTVRVVNE